MAEQAELDARIARLETALGAAAAALEAAKTRSAGGGDLEAARSRIEELETEARARETSLQEAIARADAAEARPGTEAAPTGEADAVRMRAALEALQASSTELRAQHDGAVDASLKAENEALKAARAMDLAEMKALLAELEPMLEASNA